MENIGDKEQIEFMNTQNMSTAHENNIDAPKSEKDFAVEKQKGV